MVRKTTNKILEMAEEGMIPYKSLTEMALSWMSEDDVADMARANDLLLNEEDYQTFFKKGGLQIRLNML